ncbi:MAG: DUF460 domain-containing protein [Candidatus Micrarchaeaceae archaeon]
MSYIIVGIDPGKTAAIACLTLDGRVAYLDYGISVGTDWFVERINRVGTPIIVASDKKKVGKTISKISAIFGAVLYAPEADISVEKKKDASKGINLENIHERDALAAAKTAYNVYANKLRQADRIAKEKNIEAEAIKAQVIKKSSIKEAVAGIRHGRH